MMRRGATAAAILVVLAATAWAQGPAGGGNFFGATRDASFSANDAFVPPKVPLPPSVTPVQALVPEGAPIGFGADGGLLPPAPSLWSGGGEIGLNGAEGNAQLFNLRIGLDAQRKAIDNILTANFLYIYTEQQRLISVHQALFNARDEMLFAGSPWSLFASTNIEYDQLRGYRFRAGIYAGVGYTVVDDATQTFKLRAGVGAVRELGTGDLKDRWVPEFVFGYDYRYKLNDRSSLMSSLDFYPRIDDFSKFRVRFRAGYEYVLDPATGMVLRVGIQDRYDSDPGNAKRNDLTYFATLGVKF